MFHVGIKRIGRKTMTKRIKFKVLIFLTFFLLGSLVAQESLPEIKELIPMELK